LSLVANTLQANRAHIVETASALFRERGYDAVGVAEMMAAAGFTHGGFYKHFRSKADLMGEAAASGISQTVEKRAGVDVAVFFERYVSRARRDARSDGCTMAALGGMLRVNQKTSKRHVRPGSKIC
jgi:TetR/AcrR family transcriptional repressor of nem operon